MKQDVAKQLRDQQMVMKGHRDDALVHVGLILYENINASISTNILLTNTNIDIPIKYY